MGTLNFLGRHESGIGLVAAVLRVERMAQFVSGLAANLGRCFGHADHRSRQTLAFLDRSTASCQTRREQHQPGMIRKTRLTFGQRDGGLGQTVEAFECFGPAMKHRRGRLRFRGGALHELRCPIEALEVATGDARGTQRPQAPIRRRRADQLVQLRAGRVETRTVAENRRVMQAAHRLRRIIAPMLLHFCQGAAILLKAPVALNISEQFEGNPEVSESRAFTDKTRKLSPRVYVAWMQRLYSITFACRPIYTRAP